MPTATMDLDAFHVITVISNPIRYESRYKLYKKFAEHMEQSGAQLWTVEVAFGKRPFEVTEPNNPKHLQLRTFDEVWIKENALNLLIARLPIDWKYVAWIDADIEFLERNWLVETWHALQRYAVVQLFSHALNMGPKGEPISQHTGFMYCHVNGIPFGPQRRGVYPGGYNGHPGYAWAANKYAMNYTGLLLDTAAAGAADHHMALALVGRADESIPPDNSPYGPVHPGYTKSVMQWEERAILHLRKDVGYVPGTVRHFWHGKIKNRRYKERWEILTKHQFNPDTDLIGDWQGLWQITESKPDLRDDLRAYFSQRNEDSIDVD